MLTVLCPLHADIARARERDSATAARVSDYDVLNKLLREHDGRRAWRAVCVCNAACDRAPAPLDSRENRRSRMTPIRRRRSVRPAWRATAKGFQEWIAVTSAPTRKRHATASLSLIGMRLMQRSDGLRALVDGPAEVF
jgi:hypothetical protein